MQCSTDAGGTRQPDDAGTAPVCVTCLCEAVVWKKSAGPVSFEDNSQPRGGPVRAYLLLNDKKAEVYTWVGGVACCSSVWSGVSERPTPTRRYVKSHVCIAG